MIRHTLRYAALGTAICLQLLAQPVTAPQAALAIASALLCALPGLLFAQKNAVWGCAAGFGDALSIGLPLTFAFGFVCPKAPLFAVTHFLAYRLIGGWALRRNGIRTEKNFPLISAYRQTLAHCSRFPNEIHPYDNPLFQSARNAQKALGELLPVLGVVIALLHYTAKISIDIRTDFIWTLMLLFIPTSLPDAKPTFVGLSVILVRTLLGPVICMGLYHIAEQTLSPALLLLSAAPVLPTLVDDLRDGGTDSSIVAEIDQTARWHRLIWILLVFATVLAPVLA